MELANLALGNETVDVWQLEVFEAETQSVGHSGAETEFQC
jgi:hypothetical protein